MGKPTANDFDNATSKELMKTYKLDGRRLELEHRKVLYGAKQHEMRREYEKLYRRKG